MLHQTDSDLFTITTLLSVKDGQCRRPLWDLDDNLQLCGRPIYKHFPYCKNCCHYIYDHFGQKK